MPPDFDDSTAQAGVGDGPGRPFSPPAWLYTLLLVAVLGAAAAFRLARIGSFPGGLYPDEAAEGWDAYRLLHVPGFHPLFFDDDGGREVLFGYLTAGVFSVAGVSITVLRATAAVLGVLGVAATPLMMRRFGRVASLAATSWAAGSLWLVAVDRDGFRNVLVPLVATLAVTGLLAWVDRPGPGRALLAGAACGLGLWTYQPLKLLPLLVVVWLLVLRRRRDPAWPALRATLGRAAAGFAVLAAPIVAVAVTDTSNYFSRGLAVSAGNPEYGLSSLPIHTLRTLAMFGFSGDPNPRHNAGGLALLALPVALLFAAGVARAWRRRADPGHLLLLCGLPVFLLPPLVALEGGAPHFLRSLGLAPFCAAFVGLGVAELVERGRALSRTAAFAAVSFCSAVLLAASLQGAQAYFSRGDAELYNAYAYDLAGIARAAGAHDVVLLDPYRALDVQAIDHDAPPRIIDPSGPAHVDRGTVVLARERSAIATVLGDAVASRAVVFQRDPAGDPSGWRVVV